MKYYLIAGEASGDLHASHLMRSIKHQDPNAEFRFFGGDLMKAEGGICVRHYKDIAYMGFTEVLLHLRTILKARKQCKKDILAWQPDAVILVDYADFNLNIAKFLRDVKSSCKKKAPLTYYYISPKIWAWKEYRIKNFRRDVDEMFSILPFEVDYFKNKHNYPVHYVGNPTNNEVKEFNESYTETFEQFCDRNALDTRPIIAVLAGSRKQEIVRNLPSVIKATSNFKDYQIVLAGAPSMEDIFYVKYLDTSHLRFVMNETYELLHFATAAIVTSGTATLETCCFNVPQVVIYNTPLPKISRFLFNHFLKVKYVSLVNLIANREVVPELIADKYTVENIRKELKNILPKKPARRIMLDGYADVHKQLGDIIASDNAARIMVDLLLKR